MSDLREIIPAGRKPMCDKRRKQIRKAQRAYRERKKERFELLERLHANSTSHRNITDDVPVPSRVTARVADAEPLNEPSDSQPPLSLDSPSTEERSPYLKDRASCFGKSEMQKGVPSPTQLDITCAYEMMQSCCSNAQESYLQDTQAIVEPSLEFSTMPGDASTAAVLEWPESFRNSDLLDDLVQPPKSSDWISSTSDPDLNTNIAKKLVKISRSDGQEYQFLPGDIHRYIASVSAFDREQLGRMAATQPSKFVDIFRSKLLTFLYLRESDRTERVGGDGRSLETAGLPADRRREYSGSPVNGMWDYDLRDVSQTTFYQPSATPMEISFRPPCLFQNTLRIGRLSYFTAIFANATALKFDFSDFLDESSTSPFCESVLAISRDIPRDLRPVVSQTTGVHHPYLDVLPFPIFRQRALAAILADPPLLDEDDLCYDLMLNDGLLCWGAAAGRGMDQGSPWEAHSWEAKGWFLHKW